MLQVVKIFIRMRTGTEVIHKYEEYNSFCFVYKYSCNETSGPNCTFGKDKESIII